MRLTHRYSSSLAVLGLIGALALGASAPGAAADGRGDPDRPLAGCPVQGGEDASSAVSESRPPRREREPGGSAPARRIDWRSMLPAVTLRSRG